MRKSYTEPWIVLGAAVALAAYARPTSAQMEMDPIASKHTELSPERRPAPGDSARALKLAGELRAAIAKYKDTAVAIADGYQMFLPNLKQQKVYHFTNNARGFVAAFRFDPSKPTSILYSRARTASSSRRRDVHDAEEREPRPPERPRPTQHRALAQARELVPAEERQRTRCLERSDGQPVFGPEEPDRDQGRMRRGASATSIRTCSAG